MVWDRGSGKNLFRIRVQGSKRHRILNPQHWLERQKATSHCCGSGINIPDPNFFHPGSASKNCKYFNTKIVSKISEIWSGSWSCYLPIPDPGVKKAPDPGSGSATPTASAGKICVLFRREGGVPAACDVPVGGGGQADEAAAAGGQAGQDQQVRGAGHRQGARHHQGVQVQGDHRGWRQVFLNIGGLCHFIGFLFHIQYWWWYSVEHIQ